MKDGVALPFDYVTNIDSGSHCDPFNTGCVPLNYSGNPGVNGVSHRGTRNASDLLLTESFFSSLAKDYHVALGRCPYSAVSGYTSNIHDGAYGA